MSHDRYLLERVSRRILALDGRGQARYFADLSQWEDWRSAREEAPPPDRGAATLKQDRPGLSAKESKELRNMESSIRAAEEKAAAARLALEEPAVAADAAELIKRQEHLDAARRKIDALFQRWEELEARRVIP